MNVVARDAGLGLVIAAQAVAAAAQDAPTRTLITNVTIFDGVSDTLIKNGSVVIEGAYADLLLIDSDPTQDIRLLMDSDNIDLIMKDGVIYKDTL
jgi:hypothetical protein